MTDRSLPFSFAMEERDFRGARTITQLCGSPAQGRVRFLAGWGIRFFRFPRSCPGCGLREKEWRKGAPLPLSRSSLPLPLPRWVRGGGANLHEAVPQGLPRTKSLRLRRGAGRSIFSAPFPRSRPRSGAATSSLGSAVKGHIAAWTPGDRPPGG